MQKIGAHVSAAGGIQNAPENAHKEKCEAFQFFLSSPYSYSFKKLDKKAVQDFKDTCAKYELTDYWVHAPYLVNLASLDNRIRHGSISLLRKSLEEGSKIGVQGVMFHTGSSKGHDDKSSAIKKAIESLNKVLDGYTGTTKLLIENAAGAGGTLGVSFKEVGTLLKGVKGAKAKKHMGVCIDTQHAFASGYDWRTKAGTNKAMSEFDKEVGIKMLNVVQVNDSKIECGGNRDRHEHIKNGLIGKQGMVNILKHATMKSQSFLLETKPDGRAADMKTLKKIRDSK